MSVYGFIGIENGVRHVKPLVASPIETSSEVFAVKRLPTRYAVHYRSACRLLQLLQLKVLEKATVHGQISRISKAFKPNKTNSHPEYLIALQNYG